MTPTVQQLERIADTTDSWCAWEDTPTGRQGWWCKICRDEGREWIMTTCEHILKAQKDRVIPREVGMATLRKLMSERPS